MTAPPEIRRRVRWPLLFLAGPVIWYLHFWLVYLVAEAVCTAGGFDLAGIPFVTVVTVAATVLAVALIIVLTVIAYRRWRGDDDPDQVKPMLWAGYALGALFALGTVFVGASAVLVPPC